MLYSLSHYALYHGHITLLNLLRYLSFRTTGACLTALFISFFSAPPLIRLLHHHQKQGQPIRALGPKSHIAEKSGTPTMGGIIILLSLTLSILLWGNLGNGFLDTVLLLTLGFGAIGFFDDYKKLSQHTSDGLSKKTRLFWEFLFSALAVTWIQHLTPASLQNHLAFPFIKNFTLSLGIFYILFGMIVITGFGNAVNFTDGLDGLATGCIIITTITLIVMSYVIGNAVSAHYLNLHHIPNTGELAIFCGALIGACLGFLWYNAKPANIFMGDTGSLALGAAIGGVGVAIKHEFILAFIGGIFVIEMFSVIIQVLWFKKTGKRFFLMAPIHHHFERKGASETQIVIRFWIVTAILGICGLLTFKLQ